MKKKPTPKPKSAAKKNLKNKALFLKASPKKIAPKKLSAKSGKNSLPEKARKTVKKTGKVSKNRIRTAPTRLSIAGTESSRAVLQQMLGDLPFSYNETKLVLLVRDPYWAYGYWDFSGETWDWIETMRHQKKNLREVLRIHNLNEKNHFDIDVQLETKNWYINLGLPDADFEAELGFIDSFGKFYRIAKSNRIHTPRNGPSNVIDENWRPKYFNELYRLSGGGKTGSGSEIFSPFRKT